MTEKNDFYIVPKFAWNDYGDSGLVKSGRLIITKNFIFMLIEKEDFGKSLNYDPIKVDNLLNVAEQIDLIDFEAEMLDIIPNPSIFKVENLEYLELTNSFIAGGMAFKRKSDQDGISFEIPKRSVRKEVVEFCKDIVK